MNMTNNAHSYGRRGARAFAPPQSYQQQAYESYTAAGTPYVQRTLTSVSNANPSPLDGCCNFFERCNGEIMSLHFNGNLDLLDWMGFEVSNECYKVWEFIAYVRPEFSGGNATAGHLANACADPNGYEYGKAKISIENFGRYGRSGPTRDIMKPERYCATDPVRRLDGQPVTSEREWDLRFAVDVMLGDIRRDLIIGNKNTAGQFDGLERWVKTGYAGPNGGMLDSYVVNWAGNSMSGGNGITINGQAIANTFNFIDVLLSLTRNIRNRMQWARQLQNQPLMLGDMILLLPDFASRCLLDFYTCWSVCDGSQFNPVELNSFEGRSFRKSLTATSPQNLFGFGFITLDNITIPLLTYDWELIKGPNTADIYLLTGSVGSVRLWEGEHLSANAAASQYSDWGYGSIDGGRILTTAEVNNECAKLKAWMHPRIFCKAPWAQIRFQNVQCVTPGGPLSSDPLATSFFPLGTSFSAANC